MAELVIDAADSFTEQAARRALREAGQRAGIDSSAAGIIRLGSNAVFRLGAESPRRVRSLWDAPGSAESSDWNLDRNDLALVLEL